MLSLLLLQECCWYCCCCCQKVLKKQQHVIDTLNELQIDFILVDVDSETDKQNDELFQTPTTRVQLETIDGHQLPLIFVGTRLRGVSFNDDGSE